MNNEMFSVLADVTAAVPGGILIGDLGTWVRLHGLAGDDIDLIITRPDLARVTGLAEDVSRSRHLAAGKWRAVWRGIHLDLYVPYESRLGERLRLRTEDLAGMAEEAGGFRVLTVDAHIATKLAALLDRPDSMPGQKDRAEIGGLLEIGGAGTGRVLLAASEVPPKDLRALVDEAAGYLTEPAGISRSDRDRIRRIAATWIPPAAG